MTENITYQNTHTVKKTRLPAGSVKKMSIAVLVDNELTWQQEKTGFKRVLAAPTPEKLKIIHDLVAGSAGFSAERGDQLVVETLPFESTLTVEPPETVKPVAPAKPQGPMKWPPDRNTLFIGGGAALVLIVAGFLAATMWRKGKTKASASVEKALPAGDPAPKAVAQGDNASSIEKALESKLAEREALQAQLEAQALKNLQLAPVITKTAEILAKHLREKIKNEPEVSAQVLRTWIHEGEN
jgi:flagellar biosynthesis/type III secretory pathway M-ring protein FliF/YscJ